MANEKVVLAYSGGLDTSVCIRYLQTLQKFDVISLTVDCGQKEDFKAIEKKALDIGVIKHIFVDGKEELAHNYIIPSIKSNGLYEDKYPLATALARPLISAKLVEEAHNHQATAVAHGCTGKGNDQIRFDVTIRALDPHLKIIAPIRDMNLTRDLEIKFAQEQDIPISSEAKKYSVDVNIWGRAIEGGSIEDANSEPSTDAYQFVKFDNDRADYLELEFEKGIPVAADGKRMKIINLIDYVNNKAGGLGVGIVDHIEDRVVGIKSREIYEAPAAVVIVEAHKDLEKMVLTNHEIRFKRIVDEQWSWLVYSGLWKEPLRSHLDKFIDATQKKVSGKVKLKMQKGSLRIVGRESQYSLYRNELATYSAGSTFDQSLAKGFVELWGLQSTVANMIDRQRSQDSKNGGGAGT
ncbi:MAG TPA: argininosuccinate synthase [Candidatus Nitrosopolaris sp.]|nr:argininosuccinate synthase [Candidatus Nitrosopolaris sp.]